jgi:hypothetical protein
MMIRTLSLAALAVLAAPTAASAQSNDSGFRFEVFGGYDRFKDDLGEDSDLFNPEVERDFDAAFGANIGYDFVRGGAVRAGVDLEYVTTTAKTAVFTSTGVRNGDVEYGNEIYGGGRVTFAVSPTIAVVGKLGMSYIETEYTAPVLTNSDNDSVRGPRGALGLQFSNGEDRTYYGIEGRYGNYNRGLTRQSVLLVVGHRF